MRNVTGHLPDTCPWSAFSDPVVQDVVEAYGWEEQGQLAMWWGSDPPNHLIEGMHVFKRAVARTRDAERRERDKTRLKERNG